MSAATAALLEVRKALEEIRRLLYWQTLLLGAIAVAVGVRAVPGL